MTFFVYSELKFENKSEYLNKICDNTWNGSWVILAPTPVWFFLYAGTKSWVMMFISITSTAKLVME